MQQAESENPVTQEMSTNGESEAAENVPTYDQQFPSLGGGAMPANSAPPIGRWNKKPPLQSSIITQLFFIPAEERKGLNGVVHTIPWPCVSCVSVFQVLCLSHK